MANVYAVKSGNWSDTTLWNTSALPATVDDVYANGFTVYVDGNYQVISVRNKATTGINAGGGFILNNGVSLSANVEGSGVTGVACVSFLSADPSFATIVGNISANNTAIQLPLAVIHNGTGILNIIGNGLGGANNNSSPNTGYIINNNRGTLNIIGTILGSLSPYFYGVNNNSTGTVNVTGSLIGSLGSRAFGLNNNSAGFVNIVGYVSGGPTGSNTTSGVNNNSTGTITIQGSAFASMGITSYGASNVSTGTISIIGTIIGGPAGAATQPHGVVNSSGGTINVIGRVLGGTAGNGYGISNTSTGSVNITGEVRAGPTSEAWGINNSSTATVSISGNIFGGSATNAYAIINSLGTVYLLGNTTGGTGTNSHGLLNSSGLIYISGNAIGGLGSGAYGAVNNATGYMEVNGIAVGNGWGLGSSGIGGAAPGIFGSQTGTTIIRGLSCGPRGQWPTAGNVFIVPQNTSTATFETSAFQDVTLFTSLSTNIVPPASSVRLGTKYNLNDYTGTCNMPSISSVLQGVSVDNSIGIAALQPQTIWNYSTLSATDVNSLGGRLANVATVQSIGQQLTALNL